MKPRIHIGSPIQWAGNKWHIRRILKAGATIVTEVAGRKFSQELSFRQLESVLPKRK